MALNKVSIYLFAVVAGTANAAVPDYATLSKRFLQAEMLTDSTAERRDKVVLICQGEGAEPHLALATVRPIDPGTITLENRIRFGPESETFFYGVVAQDLDPLDKSVFDSQDPYGINTPDDILLRRVPNYLLGLEQKMRLKAEQVLKRELVWRFYEGRGQEIRYEDLWLGVLGENMSVTTGREEVLFYARSLDVNSDNLTVYRMQTEFMANERQVESYSFAREKDGKWLVKINHLEQRVPKLRDHSIREIAGFMNDPKKSNSTYCFERD